jgi:hypothetical protein
VTPGYLPVPEGGGPRRSSCTMKRLQDEDEEFEEMISTYGKAVRGVLGTELVIRGHDEHGLYLTILEYYEAPEVLEFGGLRWERTEECEPRGELVRRRYRPVSS